eukprot:3752133-Prorocentrum_lima.AAC.1
MTSSLVGSEMCIRDRAPTATLDFEFEPLAVAPMSVPIQEGGRLELSSSSCLLYTSDAADDM